MEIDGVNFFNHPVEDAFRAFHAPLKRYRDVQRDYTAAKQLFSKRQKMGSIVGQKRKKYINEGTSGIYVKFPLVTSRRYRGKLSNYERNGAVQAKEAHGNLSMQQILYIGTAAFEVDSYFEVLFFAIIRYLQRRKGIEIASLEDHVNSQPVAGESNNNALNGLRIWYKSGPSSADAGIFGSVTSYVVNVGATPSSYQDFVNDLRDKIDGIASNNREIWAIEELRGPQSLDGASVGGVTATYRMYADRLKLRVYGYARLNIQNATVSESGSQYTDIIDSNPLNGRIYYYKGDAPKLRQDQRTDINAATQLDNQTWPGFYSAMDNGIWWPSTLAPREYENVPPPGAFRNITGTRSINLDPGKVTCCVTARRLEGSLSYLWQRCFVTKSAAQNQQTAATFTDPGLNRGLFVALEKRIKGTNTLKVYYHLDQYHGAVVTRYFGGITRPSNRTVTRDGNIVPPTALLRSFGRAVTDADVRIPTDNQTTDSDYRTTDCTAGPVSRALKRSRRRVHIAEDAEEEPTS